MKREWELIERADKEVSLFDVLEDLCGIKHPRSGRSFKGWCPFSWEHPDGGVDRTFRTYPSSNTGYCFEMHSVLTPSRIAAYVWDMNRADAARRLLRQRGLLGKRPYRERWKEIASEREQRAEESIPMLVEALRMSASKHPNWQAESVECEREFEEVLDTLDEVLKTDPDSEAIRKWFLKAKDALLARLSDLKRSADTQL